MTPEEAQNFYLIVGKDRRKDAERGIKSRHKERPVMGRKGIGKLAPFGVCKQIEVISAGGDYIDGKGHLVSHFFLKYDDIIKDTEETIPLKAGELDKSYKQKPGTIIRLSNFAVKTVPNRETFHRQLATRFIFIRSDFKVSVKDINTDVKEPIQPSEIKCVEGTKIDLSTRPVFLDTGTKLPVKGWLAMAVESHKNAELAGVRIYAREKIVGQTRDFEQPAGFTGEFTVRSYLVGVVEADWLDLDDGEDLVRSDRQGILWDSDYGQALQKWGAELIREIGKISKEPRRKKKSNLFMEISKFTEIANKRFPNNKIIVDVAVDLATKIGGFAAEDELGDDDYVNGLSEIILEAAPHKALIDAFQDFNKAINKGEESIEQIVDLFDKTRIAEMASYSRIASERVQAIKNLESIINKSPNENEFQKVLADAPWLIEPTWSVISKNQALKTFKDTFENWWKEKYHEDIILAIGYENKRPDFTLINVGNKLHIVEIKKKGHSFDDADCNRLLNYVDAFRDFFTQNKKLASKFPNGWVINLIADGIDLKELNNKFAYESFEKSGELERTSWIDFLANARISHEEFLNVSEEFEVRKS
jgi:hypothetical protein